MQPQKPATDWKYYRFLRRAFWLTWLVPPLILVGIGILTNSEPLVIVLFPIWGIAFGVSAFRFYHFRCPSCGRPYFYTDVCRAPPFAQTCRHCGLRKWTASTAKA